MTTFALASVGLLALALAFVLPTLWRARRRQALAWILALPLATAGLYHWLGTPAALDPRNVEAPKTLEDAIAQLERRLADEPDRPEGWVLLARSRMGQGEFAKARDAYARAHALAPTDPGLMVEYADAQLRAGNGVIPAETEALLRRALELDPVNQRGLFFLGMLRARNNDAAGAAALWERLLPLLEPAAAQALLPQLQAAREAAGLPPLSEPAAPAPLLRVRIDIAPELRAQLRGDESLFVIARAENGPPMPVAAKRVGIADFPIEVALSDADSPMPSGKLSQTPRVQLLARIARSGDAQATAGDFESAPLTVDTGGEAVHALRIEAIVE